MRSSGMDLDRHGMLRRDQGRHLDSLSGRKTAESVKSGTRSELNRLGTTTFSKVVTLSRPYSVSLQPQSAGGTFAFRKSVTR